MSVQAPGPLCLRDDGTIYVTAGIGSLAIVLSPDEMRAFAAGLLKAAEHVERTASAVASAALHRAAGGQIQ